MKQFFEKNKIFIGIIIAALIIGGFVYLSNKPTTTSLPTGGKEMVETPGTPTPPETSGCIDYTKAGEHIGEYGCVTGRVDHVFTSDKGNNFLNFCSNYKTCPFSAVIFNTDANKFSNIKGYGGKMVEITGLIKTYEGRAEIIINDPSQIKIK